ncbi:alpha-L-fucosidase [candidate division KSB1 bacterium]
MVRLSSLIWNIVILFIIINASNITEKRRIAFFEKTYAQTKKYEPSWKSLDSHPLPGWYDDAKYGMFIDWGIYSVPGWAPRVDPKKAKRIEDEAMYPDWYLREMYIDKDVIEYHKKVWGAEFERDDFIPMFTASKYNPEALVRTALDAGMKYIVLFCKHHDGFCLWPCEHTHRDAGEMGPKRDLVKPLIDECKKAGLKFGFYFSVEEWEYPVLDETGHTMLRLWYPINDKHIFPYREKEMEKKISGKIPVGDFINEYIYPQAVSFIDKYDPDILWFDGEWSDTEDYYKTKDIVSYFYNNAEGRKEVVVNDRLGKGNRDVHGDFFTSEYGRGKKKDKNHKWEENRGISQSFGYNREDTDENVITPKQLVDILVNYVANNGNLLLVVNLDGEGEMPGIYKKRLKATGDWLKLNGDAIYGTRPCKVPSEGNDIFYTRKNNTVYAICLNPKKDNIILTAVKSSEKTVITLLGSDDALEWKEENDKLFIEIPQSVKTKKAHQYGYTIKITNAK